MTLDIATPDLSLEVQAFVGRSVAVLGITGSGKTNTAAVLIEELLTQGLPMTIVDIEGEYWGLNQAVLRPPHCRTVGTCRTRDRA
jgi:DNA helicase HerA-like ATPase